MAEEKKRKIFKGIRELIDSTVRFIDRFHLFIFTVPVLKGKMKVAIRLIDLTVRLIDRSIPFVYLFSAGLRIFPRKKKKMEENECFFFYLTGKKAQKGNKGMSLQGGHGEKGMDEKDGGEYFECTTTNIINV